MEQKNVYRHLNFDVGVYQAANLTVRDVSLYVLSCPSVPSRQRSPAGSNYAACHHESEAPIDANNNGVFYRNSRTRLDEIEDGLSNTIFVGRTCSGGR